MKLLHLSDIHWCREHRDEATASLETTIAAAIENRIDLWALAGDLFDRGLQASDRDALPELIALIRRMLDIAPIVAVAGTPSHDVPGCYAVLTGLRARHEFRMLYPDQAIILGDGGRFRGATPTVATDKLLILGSPEPGKEWLLSNRRDLGASDATQAAVEAMRALLLGLGSMRREHPDIPALFLYHGGVREARLGASQTVGAQELAIGREDLRLVDPLIRAEYGGSGYPGTWGELTQKVCKLVTLRGCATYGALGHYHDEQIVVEPEAWDGEVERIPFPHAPRVKVAVEAERNAETSAIEFDGDLPELHGEDVWLAIAHRDGLAIVDDAVWLAWLRERGAGPGSRVTMEKVAVETVRAREITEAQHLREKVIVWAEASSLPTPSESVLAKADALEEEGRAAGVTGQGQHIRQRSLRLRGAKAILKGLGAEEIVLDLDRYDAGLIAIVAPNGSGKTGLLSRFHPFPDSPPRVGFLHEHFALKDSASEFVWTDERTQTDYRSLILIDPTLSTPKTEYHLYKRNSYGDWIPLTKGRKEAYLELITSMWGSIDLYMRSAYVPQWDTPKRPELGSATKDERQGLFVELGGLTRFEWYAQAAKGRRVVLETAVQVDQARADELAKDIARKPEIAEALAATGRKHEQASAEQKEIEQKGHYQRSVVEDLALQVAEQRSMVERRRALTEEGSRLLLEASDIDKRRAAAEKALGGRAAAQTTIQQAADLDKAKGALSEKKAAVATRREAIVSQHASALAAHRTARDAVQAEIRRLEKAASQVEQRKAQAVAQVDVLTAEVAHEIDESCPTCHQALPEAMREELRAAQDRKRQALAERQEQVLGLDAQLIDNQKEQAAQNVVLAGMHEPKAPTLPAFDEQPALDTVLASLARLDVTAARETVRLADAASAQIAEGERRRGEIGTRQTAVEQERKALLSLIDETIPAKHAAAKTEHERLQRAYAEARAEVARLNEKVESFTRELEAVNAKAEAFTSLKAEIVKRQADLSDWRYLERACGRDGIQALELDALGPSVSAEATALLRVAREAGARTPFDAVRIVTQRIAGKGAKTRMVEAFTIACHDTRPEAATIGEEWEDLGMICGGERVWLRAAIYQAFAVIRARSTGLRFDVMILDEADGALDAEARVPYLRMLERGHADSGRHQTLIVTHSPELQQAIAQRVEMRELVREGVGA